MTTQILGDVILWLIVIAIVIVVAVYLLRWLYRRSTKETAFVRTGFLGEKVVINGGAFVIPVLHDVTPVSMNVMRIEVRRSQASALITRDRMRIDLLAEFFVRVQPTRDAVAFAAQTLGSRAMQPDSIRTLLEGKFASALRAIAAEMTIEQIHEHRKEFTHRIKDNAAEALAVNGLELESVALVDLDQTSLEFFDPSNAFDAEGLTQLTEAIEMRRKMRNQIEQQTMIEIRNQNLDAERRVLEIERESEYARLEQEREIEVRRAAQRAELVRERAVRDQEGQHAQMAANESVEKARIVQERVLSESRIANEEEVRKREIARRRSLEALEIRSREETEREQIALEILLERDRVERQQQQEELEVSRLRAVELAEQDRQIALAQKSVEVSRADSERRGAEIAAELTLEQARVDRDRSLDQARLERERALEALRVEKRRAFEVAEVAAQSEVEQARIASQQSIERAQIAAGLALERDRIGQRREQETLDVARRRAVELAEREREVALAEKQLDVLKADAEVRRVDITSRAQVETERFASDRKLDEARIERERALEALEISKRQAFEEAEIVSGEEIERARIATGRGLDEARLVRERDLRRLGIERDQMIESAEIDKAIELAKRSKERSAAIVEAEVARSQAVLAEEQAFTVREREIAERRRTIDLIGARREAEREGLRLTSRAQAEMEAAKSFGDAQRTEAKAAADAEIIRIEAAAKRYKVEAEGNRMINEAENALSEPARASRTRGRILDKLEGIVRESVRPLEKIEGIKILHVDGLGGNGGDGRRNVTDEVIDSALRYRVQAPMIDSLMKEVGIDGSSVGRMTDVLRDAKDIDSLTRSREKGKPAGGREPAKPDEDDRDR